MQIEIRVGDCCNAKRVSYNNNFRFDNTHNEKENMYKFLKHLDNCIVENVDMFLLYAINNGLSAFYVKDNADSDDNEFHSIPTFDPSVYKIFSMSENGEEVCIQDSEGTIKVDYFNKLMKEIMDDFYLCLNYF